MYFVIHQCAHGQPPNLRHMLLKSNRSSIPTLVGNSKCVKPRCQVCDILDRQKKLHIPGTSSTIQPGNNNCHSYNIVYVCLCLCHCLTCCIKSHCTPATLAPAHTPCLFSIDLHTVRQHLVIVHFLLLPLLSGTLFQMMSSVPHHCHHLSLV